LNIDINVLSQISKKLQVDFPDKGDRFYSFPFFRIQKIAKIKEEPFFTLTFYTVTLPEQFAQSAGFQELVAIS